MQVWQRAADLSGPLFKLAEKLDERRYFRFAEQLRAAALSIELEIERILVEGFAFFEKQ